MMINIVGNQVMNELGMKIKGAKFHKFITVCSIIPFFREAIQEDESGSIMAVVNAINQKNRRKELAQLPNVRLGMVGVIKIH